MKTALVIMAAGMGSRFKGGVKQLEGVGPNGEIITDYSVYDALEAGFDEVIFIIRRDIEEAFHAAVGQRLVSAGVPVRYAYQELTDLPAGVDSARLLAGRTKPWGTGQAVLSCKGILDCPFAVINADDYYGKEAFRRMHQFLQEGVARRTYCMAGFRLKNTLSDHGSVTRGICQTDDTGRLVGITETKYIEKAPNGVDAMVSGALVPGDTLVSMNMWGLDLEFLDVLEDGFLTFLQRQQGGQHGGVSAAHHHRRHGGSRHRQGDGVAHRRQMVRRYLSGGQAGRRGQHPGADRPGGVPGEAVLIDFQAQKPAAGRHWPPAAGLFG